MRTAVRAEQWFEQYLQTIIKNDVADVADIKDEDDLLRLAKHLALRTGKLLNTSSIANELKIGRDKTDKYISILEHLFLVYRLPGWHNNLSKRAVKAPKLHLVEQFFLSLVQSADNTSRTILNQQASGINREPISQRPHFLLYRRFNF